MNIKHGTPMESERPFGKSGKVGIVGAGLAGSDCAWVLAEHYKLQVVLYEMKPARTNAAQFSPNLFAELVCSNSLKSLSLLNPAGLLKDEMRALGSLVCAMAFLNRVPAGEALAVDRENFSAGVTGHLKGHPRIVVKSECVESAQKIIERDALDLVIIATGPLTEGKLATELEELAAASGAKKSGLYFYDAIAPIIDGHSVDLNVAFRANRENHLERKKLKPTTSSFLPCAERENQGDYLNLPLSKEQYLDFVAKLNEAPKVPHHAFEEPKYFNGCQPIENLAASGPLTLAHGPMKGRGLTNPRTGRWPFAAVQLRREKLGDAAYNMVGFQTRLTWTAQRELFRTLPGLEGAEFHRMGSMHRNTYLCSPEVLDDDFCFKANKRIALAGQIMGVEGYLESAAMGCYLGHFFGHRLTGRNLPPLPKTTAMGCLSHYVLNGEVNAFTPMNIHWGLFEPMTEGELERFVPEACAQSSALALRSGPLRIGPKLDKGTRRLALSKRCQEYFNCWFSNSGIKRGSDVLSGHGQLDETSKSSQYTLQ